MNGKNEVSHEHGLGQTKRRLEPPPLAWALAISPCAREQGGLSTGESGSVAVGPTRCCISSGNSSHLAGEGQRPLDPGEQGVDSTSVYFVEGTGQSRGPCEGKEVVRVTGGSGERTF